MCCRIFKITPIILITVLLPPTAKAQLKGVSNFPCEGTRQIGDRVTLMKGVRIADQYEIGGQRTGVPVFSAMRRYYSLLFSKRSPLQRDGDLFRDDTVHHVSMDTNRIHFDSPPCIGGDLFLAGDFYGLHLSGRGSLTYGEGLGTEIRVRPLFGGVVAGLSGDEGLFHVHSSPPTFFFLSLYAGVTVHDFRAEIGETSASDSWFAGNGIADSYEAGFLGVSKRWSDIVFVEPGFKIVFPIGARFAEEPQFGEFVPVTRHFHLGDLFFAFSVKAGIGFN